MSDLTDSLAISAAGMKVQGVRVRVISENMANANSVADEPGGVPYRRKLITFQNKLDREIGVNTVRVKNIVEDNSDFGERYLPSHPAANAEGFVQTSNVSGLIEMMDMKEAQRSYEANLNALTISKSMLQKTVDLLR
ncbi:MAG: flagellar basal body rod protein FlgC [Rhodospirillaceae bacterium]|jgi:flagellar basal-body rod protein FlgC|nr:flagellar basal body rod protein FlgC [Rhodospirillaceae bacterium]MBT5373079.1 flagellar basal body rod protein FlgC [Rhodospirillaceae bacterium]MBT5658570.1 flagellar basal body rod protein FlgC [Rhodospirillaceae bacterium]MBT5752787.1 flagellar basal body rod protein FlgC [Rhodospirillaceae bacterium]